jgi:hypothetical protein
VLVGDFREIVKWSMLIIERVVLPLGETVSLGVEEFHVLY